MRASSLLVSLFLAAWPAAAGGPAGASAHRDTLLRIGPRSFSVLGGAVVEVERASSHCLSCHDGTVAREAFAVSGAGVAAAPPGGRGHPVDVRYPLSNPRFRPLSTLAPRLVLSDGCVSCVTCHGGTDASMKRLSVPNDRSALCLCCHVK